MWAWEAWVFIFSTLTNCTNNISILFVNNFPNYKCRNLPWSFDGSICLFEGQCEFIGGLFRNFVPESFCNIPFCSEISILGVQILHMIQPNSISENLLMLLWYNLEFTCQFKFLWINLKDSFKNLRYCTISLTNSWL